MANWAGFRPLKRGRIHIFCPVCKRKMSNLPKLPEDPKSAELSHVLCDKSRCSGGIKESFTIFFNARGKRAMVW